MIFISDSDVQMGRPRGKHVTAINEQDNEPTYQGLIIIENGMLTSYTSEINKKLRAVLGKKVGSITSRCSGKEPTLLPWSSSRGGTQTRHERAAEIEPRKKGDLPLKNYM